MEIFSELYSAYYNAVAKIITTSFEREMTDKQMEAFILKEAFSESALTIVPNLNNQKWPLLDEDRFPRLSHVPTMPLTTLQKRWLKTVLNDPRIKLFTINFGGLEEVEELFSKDDYRIYDQFLDGDNYEDEKYIANFQFILKAIKNKEALEFMVERNGEFFTFKAYPLKFEYSLKEDKISVVLKGVNYLYLRLADIQSCKKCVMHENEMLETMVDKYKEISVRIIDTRRLLERTMHHFSHFERRAERIDEGVYLLHIKYYANEETELVNRVLSLGQYVKVIEPESFIELIRQRLRLQKRFFL